MGARSLRRLSTPRPLRVETGPDARPVAVLAHGRRQRVTAVREEWLVQDRWWTDDPIDRLYLELVLETGALRLVYRDERCGAWFAHD